MGSFEDDFRELLKLYLNQSGEVVREVTSYSQIARDGGYCDTCRYKEIVVVVKYITPAGDDDTFTYYGSMTNLLDELVELDRAR